MMNNFMNLESNKIVFEQNIISIILKGNIYIHLIYKGTDEEIIKNFEIEFNQAIQSKQIEFVQIEKE